MCNDSGIWNCNLSIKHAPDTQFLFMCGFLYPDQRSRYLPSRLREQHHFSFVRLPRAYSATFNAYPDGDIKTWLLHGHNTEERGALPCGCITDMPEDRTTPCGTHHASATLLAKADKQSSTVPWRWDSAHPASHPLCSPRFLTARRLPSLPAPPLHVSSGAPCANALPGCTSPSPLLAACIPDPDLFATVAQLNPLLCAPTSLQWVGVHITGIIMAFAKASIMQYIGLVNAEVWLQQLVKQEVGLGASSVHPTVLLGGPS